MTRGTSSARPLLVALVMIALWVGAASPAHGSLASIGYSLLRLLDRADVRHHDVTAWIDPIQGTARFRDDVTLHFPRQSGAFHFLLGTGAELEGVYDAETGEPLTFSRTLGFGAMPFVVYRAALPPWPRNQGEELVRIVRFEWRLTPDPTSVLNPFFSPRYVYAGYPSLWYPHMPREGFFDADIRIHVPPGFRGIADGVLTFSDEEAGVYAYRTEAVDRLGVGAGVFRVDHVEVSSVDGERRAVESWVPAGRRSTADDVARHVALAMAFFGERLGPLPEGPHRVVDMPFLFPLSYPSMSTLVYGGNLDVIGLPGPDGRAVLAAHETAHKWLGGYAGAPVVGNAWFLEGLAEYLAHLALASYLSADHARDIFEWRVYAPFAEAHAQTAGPGRSGARPLSAIEVFDDDADALYTKGALLFRMLHRRLGDERFFGAVREFVSKHRGAHGTARDFEAIVNAMVPRNERSELTRFFRDWAHGTDHLDYALNVERVQPEAEGYAVTLRIVSVGRLTVPGPVEVAIETADGHRLNVQVELDRSLDVRTLSRPVSIRLDPERWLADVDPANNVWTP